MIIYIYIMENEHQNTAPQKTHHIALCLNFFTPPPTSSPVDSSPSQHQHFIRIWLPTWDGRISGHFLGPCSGQKKNGAVSLFHWGHFAVDSSKGSGGFIPQVTASAVVRTVVWKLISNINKKRKTFLAIPSIIVEFWRESKWNGSNKCNSSVFVD